MKTSIQIGKIFGLPVYLHWSWFIIFSLVTFSLATGYFPAVLPQLQVTFLWILGIATSLLFFASIFAHETGHVVVALREHVPVHSITLFMFGGLAQIEEEPGSAPSELRIAIAGPLTSLGLAALLGVFGLISRSSSPWIGLPALWLSQVNLTLGLFNLIPGFPLDGGRVLHAIIWLVTGQQRTANQWAINLGRLAAFGFIIAGILTIFLGDFFNGMWLGFIGWFLNGAAQSYQAPRPIPTGQDEVKVSQVVSPSLEQIPDQLSISQLIGDGEIFSGHHHFLVGDPYHPRGLLTLQEIASVPKQKWETTSVAEVMTPWTNLIHIPADMGLAAAVNVMDSNGIYTAPVVQGNIVTGLINREHALAYLLQYRQSV